MAIGIYALYWQEHDLVYIGQSQNIEARFKEHLNKMSKNIHTNYKVQNSYNLYGKPELVILEEANLDKLNDLEILWTKEFDSINNGLNIIEAGQVGWGVNSNASKYTKRQILKVFSLLYRTDLPFTAIARKCGVSESLPNDIAKGRTHKWLKEVYPDKWAKASKSRECSRYKSLPGKTVMDPMGNIIKVRYSADLLDHPLLVGKKRDSTKASIVKLLNGTLSSYLGFRLVK